MSTCPLPTNTRMSNNTELAYTTDKNHNSRQNYERNILRHERVSSINLCSDEYTNVSSRSVANALTVLNEPGISGRNIPSTLARVKTADCPKLEGLVGCNYGEE